VRTAIYCRISDDRTGEGLGVARQEKDCREFCQRRQWPIVQVLVENDVSAFGHKRRPLYRKLLNDITGGQVDALVVWHPDRLHRSPAELEQFITIVERTGVTVASVTTGDYDLGTPEGRLTARIVGSVARKESEDKSRRLRRKHLELAETGKMSGGGRRPFGYEDDHRTIRPSEAAEITAAVARILAGDSVRSIAMDWQQRGVPTVTGAAWSPPIVGRLLQSARISGQRDHQGRLYPSTEWEAIIDPADTLRIRSVLSERNAGRGGQFPKARSYLLSGFVYCGNCGQPLTARPVYRKGVKHPRYACAAERGGGCGRVGIAAPPLAELVTEAVIQAVDTPDLARRLAAQERKAPRSLADDIAALESRMAELAEMYAAAEISRAEWATARAGIDRRLTAIQTDVAADTRSNVIDAFAGRGDVLRDAWPTMTLDRRRAIIAGLIERIDIGLTTKANNRFDDSRVNITWR
jgi:DNA invertase Pin-like site-specific DNA recombinase